MKLAVVRNGVVEDVVLVPDTWTGAENEWQPPADAKAVDATETRASKGWTYDGSQLIEPEGDTPTLAEVEAEAMNAIDGRASTVRQRFITAGAGQEATYMAKHDEAKAYKAATDPVDTDYPLMNAESTRRGLTMTELADEVIGRRSTWIDPYAAQVEAERVGGKADVRAASTIEGKRTARRNALDALEAITP